jgi:hypothetical protein
MRPASERRREEKKEKRREEKRREEKRREEKRREEKILFCYDLFGTAPSGRHGVAHSFYEAPGNLLENLTNELVHIPCSFL